MFLNLAFYVLLCPEVPADNFAQMMGSHSQISINCLNWCGVSQLCYKTNVTTLFPYLVFTQNTHNLFQLDIEHKCVCYHDWWRISTTGQLLSPQLSRHTTPFPWKLQRLDFNETTGENDLALVVKTVSHPLLPILLPTYLSIFHICTLYRK